MCVFVGSLLFGWERKTNGKEKKNQKKHPFGGARHFSVSRGGNGAGLSAVAATSLHLPGYDSFVHFAWMLGL